MVDTLALLFPHSAESEGVVVRVATSYLADQSAPDQQRWFWSYHMRIENRRETSVQLLARQWTIVDGRGAIHEVRGQGVVGDMPVILPGDSYDYVSGCPLDTSSGSMSGVYQFVDEDGAPFQALIPKFPLLAPRQG
ncbi:Co2+/Mg2+ efflux protein ApaG [Sphingomonas sp. LY160]|uniref:Co2+/Mg2+ efflux protein ApaG n=1 Tax=Sphingomonas sp. LY160 TaxID=3095342 RepID=UPI002ADEBF6C|nr:Co2+/Mg2+ efflux protein ApaG [Sphingomonas sp. LY160]MEA1071011.1 Co2+/Mg2+ efflux protein ApaG [Sphingomonas sp. LY160]